MTDSGIEQELPMNVPDPATEKLVGPRRSYLKPLVLVAAVLLVILVLAIVHDYQNQPPGPVHLGPALSTSS